jgi:cell division protein FtsI (penicillin-binding protein 3)
VSDSSTTPVAETVRPSRPRAVLLHLSLVAFAVALLVQAVRVQVLDGATYAAAAEEQHMVVAPLPAPRGTIVDDRGDPLAISREVLKLVIAPNQVRGPTPTRNERDSLAKELRALGVSRTVITKALDSTRTYVEVPGVYTPTDAARLMALRGVRAEWVMQRLPSGTPGLMQLVGSIDRDGAPQGGLERALDSLLTGTRGERRALRDRRGRTPTDAPSGSCVESRPGHEVRLTVNLRLQEIVEHELKEAMERTGASGGDIVVLDPNDGAILALAGTRDGRDAGSVTPLTQAYQPGSVLKPMFVAWLLERGKARASEIIDTQNGVMQLGNQRFTDEHKEPEMSVFDIVRWSSNVGTVKLVTSRMTRDEEYELLRDYGFGVSTGLPYTAESRGSLPVPTRWSASTAASLSIGYELSATPVQLAAAYAALANGGELLEPALVREIRDPDGRVVFRHARRVLRRVASENSTEQVRAMLKAVVDSGTGKAAGLTAFEVGGKSGTARRVVNGVYSREDFDATFAGMFPMSDPQVVIVARLIEPRSAIFGGLVAGPMVRAVLLGAMAARDAALDRRVLNRVARAISLEAEPLATSDRARSASMVATATATADDDELDAVPSPRESVPAPARVVVSLPYAPETGAVAPRAMRTVPSVRGLTVREAVRTLHAAGFRVQMGRGVAGRTRPAAGASSREGSVIVLEQGS